MPEKCVSVLGNLNLEWELVQGPVLKVTGLRLVATHRHSLAQFLWQGLLKPFLISAGGQALLHPLSIGLQFPHSGQGSLCLPTR